MVREDDDEKRKLFGVVRSGSKLFSSLLRLLLRLKS